MESHNVEIDCKQRVSLWMKREDQLHPTISGNKFRKLKYNLGQARSCAISTLATFGGAFSNHISATAAAGKEFGFQTMGFIRGDELIDRALNPTLQFAVSCGMKLEFLSRDEYRKKENDEFINSLLERHGPFYLLPEGGTNALAVKGCEEILSPDDATFDYICCAVGTGGTISGIANSCNADQVVLGFPALLDHSQIEESIRKYAKRDNWRLIPGYSFGGYGKIDTDLIRFINRFSADTKIPLDPIYTGKMVFGVMDLIERGFFPDGSRVLLIHTGGLQGIEGMNQVLKKKNLPIIEVYD